MKVEMGNIQKTETMSFSRLLIMGLWCFITILWGTFVICEESPLISFTAVILTTVLALQLIMFLILIKDNGLAIMNLFTVIMIMYFLCRFWSLIIFPESIWFKDALSPIQKDDITYATLYLNLITFSVCLGFWLGSRLYVPGYKKLTQPVANFTKKFNLNIVALLLLFTVGLNMYDFIVLGFGRYGSKFIEASILRRAFSFLFQWDVILIILIVLSCETWVCITRKKKMMVFMTIALFSVSYMLRGAKSSIYYPLFFWFLYWLAKRNDFKINVKKLFIFGPPLIVLLFMSFYIGRIYRTLAFTYKKSSSLSIVQTYSEARELARVKYMTDVGKIKTIPVLFARFHGVDTLALVVNDKGVDLPEYVNIANVSKTLVNLFLPGWYFDVLPTSRVFQAVYVGISYELSKRIQTTVMWTWFGVFYVHFGLIGSILGAGCVAFLIAVFYKKLNLIKSNYVIFWKVWYLLVVHFLFISFGLDDTIFTSVFMLLLGVLYLGTVCFFSALLRDISLGIKAREI